MPFNTFLARFCAFLRVLRDNRAFSVSTRTPLVAFYENKVHFKHAHKSYLYGEHFLQLIACNHIVNIILRCINLEANFRSHDVSSAVCMGMCALVTQMRAGVEAGHERLLHDVGVDAE